MLGVKDVVVYMACYLCLQKLDSMIHSQVPKCESALVSRIQSLLPVIATFMHSVTVRPA